MGRRETHQQRARVARSVLFGSANPPRYWWKREELWKELDEIVESDYREMQEIWGLLQHEQAEMRRKIATHVVFTRKNFARQYHIIKRLDPIDKRTVRIYRMLKRADAARRAGQVYMNPHELKMMVRKMARVLYNQERSKKRARQKKSGKSGR